MFQRYVAHLWPSRGCSLRTTDVYYLAGILFVLPSALFALTNERGAAFMRSDNHATLGKHPASRFLHQH